MRSIDPKGTPALILTLLALAACGGDAEPDAYGNFEANEVVVSAQASGQLQSFTITEGMQVTRGAVVGLVDTTQLALEREQIIAQREATAARVTEVTRQIGVLDVQRDLAQRAYDRTKRLFAQQAATAQQMDQAEREYRVVVAQIEAARAQRAGVARQEGSTSARVAQLRDLIAKSTIVNPEPGTVLTTYVRTGEVVRPGQPLYRIANLDTLTLRAYVTETQLASLRLGQRVQVNVDAGEGERQAVPGTIAWISSRAEFTPTPIQTRDERANLVYAVKVSVPNGTGVLRIGMPADLSIVSPASRGQ